MAKPGALSTPRTIGVKDASSNLPDDVLLLVFARLSNPDDLVAVAATCRDWQRVVDSDPSLRKRFLPFVHRSMLKGVGEDGEEERSGAARWAYIRAKRARHPEDAMACAVTVFKGFREGISGLACLDSGAIVASSGDGTVRLFDHVSGRPLAKLEEHDGPVTAIATHAGGKVVVSASEDSTAVIWQQPLSRRHRGGGGSGRVPMAVSSGSLSGAKISAVSSRPSSAASDRSAGSGGTAATTMSLSIPGVGSRKSDADSGLTTLNGHLGSVRCLSPLFSEGGALLVATGGDDRTVNIWDTRDGRQVRTLWGHRMKITALMTVNPLKLLLSASRDGSIMVWNWATGVLKHTLSHDAPVLCVDVDDAGMVYAGTGDGSLHVWNANRGVRSEVRRVHPSPVYTCVWGHSSVFTGGEDGNVVVWRRHAEDDELKTLAGHSESVRCLVVLDREMLASGSDDRTVRLWDTASLTCLMALRGHMSPVMHMCRGWDAMSLVSASLDKTVRVWDLGFQRQMDLFDGHQKTVSEILVCNHHSLAFESKSEFHFLSVSPDIISVHSSDGTAATRQPACPPGSDAQFSCAAMNDGLAIAGQSDGTVTIFDANNMVVMMFASVQSLVPQGDGSDSEPEKRMRQMSISSDDGVENGSPIRPGGLGIRQLRAFAQKRNSRSNSLEDQNAGASNGRSHAVVAVCWGGENVGIAQPGGRVHVMKFTQHSSAKAKLEHVWSHEIGEDIVSLSIPPPDPQATRASVMVIRLASGSVMLCDFLGGPKRALSKCMVPTSSGITCLDFSPSGVACGLSNGCIAIFSFADLKGEGPNLETTCSSFLSNRSHTDAVTALCINDTHTILAGDAAGNIIAWSCFVNEASIISRIPHRAAVRALCRDHTGSYVFTGSDDGSIRAYNIAAATSAVVPDKIFKPRPGPVTRLAYGGHGKGRSRRLIAASDDGSIVTLNLTKVMAGIAGQ